MYIYININVFIYFLQRSISFRTEARPLPPMPLRTRQKASSFPRRRSSQLWSDTVDSMSHELSTKEIKRQEVWKAARIYTTTQTCFVLFKVHFLHGVIQFFINKLQFKASNWKHQSCTFLKSFQWPNSVFTTLVVKQEVSWYTKPCSLFQCQNFLWKALPHTEKTDW